MTNKIFTAKEIEFLKEYYPTKGSVFCSEQLGRTKASIFNKACRLGIKSYAPPPDRQYTHAQYEDQLLNKELDFVPLENYQGSFTKILHECIEGHTWLVAPARILEGSGCPYCASNSFKMEQPAHLYYIKIESFNETYYKIGITGTTIKDRFKSDTDKTITVLLWERYEEGCDALKEEQRLLNLYKNDRVNIKGFLTSNGNTELFEVDVLGLDSPSTLNSLNPPQ